MTATELQKLAEAAIYNDTEALPHALTVFRNAANPDAILKLLAINAELVEALKVCLDALQRIREDGGKSTSAEIVAEQTLAKAEGGEL